MGGGASEAVLTVWLWLVEGGAGGCGWSRLLLKSDSRQHQWLNHQVCTHRWPVIINDDD